MHTLRQLLQLLAEAEFEFVVIGGYAGVLHGSSLVTRDLDICAVLTEANVQRLRRIFKDLHPQHRLLPQPLSFLEIPPPGTPVMNLYLRTDWGVIDILSDVLGVGDFARLKARAETFTLGGKSCRVIALDDLIRAKEALGREKDLLAAKELRAIAAMRPPPPSAESE
jgi:predicted nucleotidyltransferase